MVSHEELSTSFGAAAGEYEAGRPDYPREAVGWMLRPVAGGDPHIRVADVGAGTGKLTRVAVELGAQVVAIDPDRDMLATLREHVPGVPTFVGTAERLPLPDAAVDAIIAGQVWHWVEPVAGSLEVGRALRSGGVLGLIWNVRDESVPWVRRLTQIMHGSAAEEMLALGDPTVAAPFSELESATWHWSRSISRDGLFAMVRSRSYIITADADERSRIERQLESLFDEVGAVGDAAIELPYVTKAYRAVRP